MRPSHGLRASWRFAALVALIVAGPALVGATSGEQPAEAGDKPTGPKTKSPKAKSPGTSSPEDARDTHGRIEKIYSKLGIKHGREEPSGCGCGDEAPKQQKGQKRRNQVKVPAFVGYLFLGLVFAAMLIPLVRALVSGYREVPSDDGDEEPEGAADPERADPRQPWRVDLSACRALAEEGRLTQAFAALHRATLLALQRRGELVLDEATTNWAYVRRLASKPALRRMLAGVTEAAERAVLGNAPPSRQRFDELEATVAAGVKQAGGRR